MNIAWLFLGFISAYVDTVETERLDMRKFSQEMTYILYNSSNDDKAKVYKARILLARLRVEQEKFDNALKSIPQTMKDNDGK